MANDLVPITPYQTKMVNIAEGEFHKNLFHRLRSFPHRCLALNCRPASALLPSKNA
jgi:hypothetical protein